MTHLSFVKEARDMMNCRIRQRLSLCLGLGILGAVFSLPLSGQAPAVTPDTAAPSSQQPGPDTAPNGAPLVNIVRPNAQGLSHNKYRRFDVTKKGLILNNSTEVSRSRLGGVISHNPNLKNPDRAATLILNEVTGANRSRLEGFLEVHGQQAAVVIANPHGITCNGCGFIHTPRATLTTGIPDIQNGQLRHFDVSQGEVSIQGAGLNAANIDHFDVVSQTAKLNAALHAKALTIITGRNVVSYHDRQISKKTPEGSASPAVAIDSSALGGMYADRIELIGAETGVGVNLRGTLVASQGDLRLSAEGKIALKNALAEGDIAITSSQGGIDTGNISARRDITLSAKAAIAVASAERVLAGHNITLTGESLTNAGAIGAGKDLSVTAGGDLENQPAARIQSNRNLLIKAAELTNHGALLALEKIEINTAGVLENAAGAAILSHATGGAITARRLINAGELRATGALKLDIAMLDNQSRGKIQAGRLQLGAPGPAGRAVIWDNSGFIGARERLVIGSSGKLTNRSGGLLLSRGTLALSIGQLANLGEISAGQGLAIRAGGAVSNLSSGKLLSERTLNIRAGALTNSGQINAGAGLAIQVKKTLVNHAAGLIQSKTAAATLTVAGSLTNRGAIAAAQNLNVRGPALNNLAPSALLLAGKNLLIEGAESKRRSDLLKNERGRILALDGDIDILTRRLDNLSPVAITSKTVLVRNRFRPGRPPAVPFFPAYMNREGYDQLDDGGRTRAYVFVPHPAELQRILKTEGRALASWGEYDWERYWQSGAGNNYDPRKWSFIVPDEANGFTSGVAALTYKEDIVTAAPGRAELAAHGLGAVRIDATTINNINSIISSANDLRLDGGTLNNEGQTLHRELSLRVPEATDTVRVQGWIRQWLFGSASLHLATEIIGKVQGIIAAGGDLSGSLTGSVNNLSRPASVPDTPAFARTPVTALKINQTEPPAGGLAEPVTFGGLFRPAARSDFILETRFQFIDVGAFYGSEYFMRRSGYRPDRRQRFLGDAYFDTQFINRQILEQAGRRFLYADTRDDTGQMKRLLEQGLAAAGDLRLSPWVSLSKEQQARLTEDIVWYEPMVYQGDIVLAPRLYLAGKGRSRLSAKGAIISARNIRLRAGEALTNRGAIEAQGDLRLTAKNDIQNTGGRIQAGADLRIESLEGDVLNQNEVRRIEYDARNVLEYEWDQGEILASKDLLLKAGKDITNLASTIRAGGDARLEADNDINLQARRREAAYYVRDSKGFYQAESAVHDTGEVSAGGNLTLTAGRAIRAEAADLRAGGDIGLRARGAVSLLDVQDRRAYHAEWHSKSAFSRKHSLAAGATRRSIGAGLSAGGAVRLQGGAITLRGAAIEAGGDIIARAAGVLSLAPGVNSDYSHREVSRRGPLGTGSRRTAIGRQKRLQRATLSSEAGLGLKAGGHLSLLAPKLSARGDITLEAERGRVYLGAGKDSAYVHEDYSKTGWFKWAAGEQGRYDETVRLPEIRAGGTLRIEAGSGVVVDYELAGNLNESIASLSRLPELAWMGRLKAREDIDWRAIEAAHDRWQRHESGLGGPGVTLVALALGAYLGGIDFSQLLGTGLEGSMAAGFNAGMTSLSVRAGVSLAAHGGDIGAVFEDLLSSDSLLAVATAGLTGGLTAHLEQAAGLDGVLPAGQVARHIERGLIRATVRAGVGTALQGGRLDEHFIQALQWQAIDTIGEVAAREIGAAAEAGRIDQAARYLAHAALGCGLGAVADGGCEAGAIGGVAGEAVGDWLRADMEARLRQGTVRGEDLQRWVDQGVSLARLAGGVGAWLATGEAGALRGGGDTAANAARHNALFLIPVIWGMLELADKALTVRDAYLLAKAMRAGDEERAAELATEIGIGLITDGLPGNNIIRKALGIFGSKGAKAAAKVENNIKGSGRIGKTAEGGSAGAMRRLEFQASPKHKSSARNTSKGVASRGPTDGQHALDNSIQVKSTSTRRIGVDKANGEIVVFDQTSDGIFHGHVRAFKNLTSAQQNALRNAGLVDKKGNF